MDEEPHAVPTLDWVHLPAGVEATSLWSCLHDSDLVRVHADALARSAELAFAVPHVVGQGSLPSDLLFVFHFAGVTELRAARSELWPGPHPAVDGLPSEIQHALVEEYQAKGRSASLSWRDFEELFATDCLEVYEANFVRNGDRVAMRFHGATRRRDVFHEVALRGESLSVTRGDGQPCSVDELIALGDAYWDAWEKSHGP